MQIIDLDEHATWMLGFYMVCSFFIVSAEKVELIGLILFVKLDFTAACQMLCMSSIVLNLHSDC